MKFLLLPVLLLTGCFETRKQFYIGQKIVVSSGFYKNCKGVIIREQEIRVYFEKLKCDSAGYDIYSIYIEKDFLK